MEIITLLANFMKWILSWCHRIWRADRVAAFVILVCVLFGGFVQIFSGPFLLLLLALMGVSVYAAATGRKVGVEELLRDVGLRLAGRMSAADSGGGRSDIPASSRYPIPPRDETQTEAEPPPPPPARRAARSRIQWTGDVLGSALGDRRSLTADSVARLEEALTANIRGQDVGINVLVRALRRQAAGVNANPNRPLSFLLVGPTGVGKTELAKITSQILARELIRFDIGQMGKDQSGGASWTLFGSPQGYVGGEGMLTSAVAAHPDAVVLIDEIEKGSGDLFDNFLAVLDEGRAKDTRSNQVINFSKTLVFFTSNLVTSISDEVYENPSKARDLVLATRFLKPELINRISFVIPMRALSGQAMTEIAEGMLENYIDRACGRRVINSEIKVERAVLETIIAKSDTKFGARDLQRVVEEIIGDPLADALLAHGRAGIRSVSLRANNGSVKVEVSS